MREALAFLTPLGGARRPSPRALRFFPVVGGLIGLALGGLWWGAARVWPAPVAGAVVVAADLALTGLLHLDGLVDSADGLLPHLDRQRRLRVMSEPDAGAFGVGVAGAVLLARWAALSSLRPAPLLLVALWALSRSAMATSAARLPYAREANSGIVAAFRDGAGGTGGRLGPGSWPGAAVPLLAAAGLGAAWSVPAGPAAVAVGAGAFVGVVALALRRLGGFTGDVLGAAGMVAETAGLLSAAARW